MKKRKNIALFLGILENDFCSAVLDGAVKGAKDFDANLFVFPMDLIDAKYAVQSINQYRYQYNSLSSYRNAEGLDGIIVEYGTIMSMADEEHKKSFLSTMGRIPTILLSEEVDGFECITVDNATGLVEVLEHLILDHGFTKIGFLSGPERNCDADARKRVFQDTIKKHNLPLGEDWIAYGNFSIYVEKEVTDFIHEHPDMEALVCANDSMAIGAAAAMRKMGLKPGKDIAITGFDDIAGGVLHEPAITTVKADPMELSYLAVKKLCEESEKASFAENQTELSPTVQQAEIAKGTQTIWHKIPTRMVKRESCGCTNFVPDKSWLDKLGLDIDWRQNAKVQMKEAENRRGLEHELGNVTREMVFEQTTEEARYTVILSVLRRLLFQSARLFLYDEFIVSEKASDWKNPDTMNLVAAYDSMDDTCGDYGKESGINYVYKKGDRPVETRKLMESLLPEDDKRHQMVIIPLFFGNKQLGLLTAESESFRFQYAYDMAGQISNTLYFVAMNEEQKRMKNALEEASLYKTRFLANMSHEIRTPINAIVGFNEMILRENKDAEIQNYAKDVKSAADMLLMLVGDILDFSKIEAGKMELVNAEYSLRSLVKEVLGMISFKAKKKNLKLNLNYPDKAPDSLIGDAGRIRQILLNLLSNAVKYTDAGLITLLVEERNRGENTVTLHFSIKDTGVGIRKEDLPRLFNIFERIDLKKNRHIEGSGLGINISSELLRLMNSELKVESTYGEGTEFYFDLEQEIAKKSLDTMNRETPIKNNIKGVNFKAPHARILVVDDNEMNRRVVCSLLKGTEMTIDQAESGTRCIQMVSETKYDIILLDHMMPEPDGVETLQKMREMNLLQENNTPVIAITANAIVGAREFYLKNGFTDYLSKPVLPNTLNEILEKYLG